MPIGKSLFRVSVLLASLCGVGLGGCAKDVSHLIAHLDAPPRRTQGDLPEARPIDADTARRLFLIIVDGLRQDGKSRAALAYLDGYERAYPGDRQAMLMRADCLLDIGQTAQAASLYRRLLDRSGDVAAAHAGLGQVAAANQDWRLAASEFADASSGDPANVAFLNDLGFAQMNGGAFPAAIESLRQAAELEAGNRHVRNNLILALHLSGNDAQARAMVDAITEPQDRAEAVGLLTLPAAALRRAAAPPATTASFASAQP
jgi:Flp pilus assembly protein TadD